MTCVSQCINLMKNIHPELVVLQQKTLRFHLDKGMLEHFVEWLQQDSTFLQHSVEVLGSF